MTTAVNNNVSQELLDAMNPKGSKGGTAVQDIQDRFLTMLVAQMKNQDPLNPLDNSQVTSQLAQLSTVSGIETLNTTMNSLMGSYLTSQNMQAANMIGHGVLFDGEDLALAGGISGFGVELETDADSVMVDVYNAAGVKVTTLDLGSGKEGVNSFTWDGSIGSETEGEEGEESAKAPDGIYTFKVTASTDTGSKVDAKTLQFGLVDNVSFNAGGTTLGVRYKGDLAFGDIKQVL